MLSGFKEEIANLKQLFHRANPEQILGIPNRGLQGLKVHQERALYRQPELLPDILEFRQYLAKHRCFVSADGKTYGTVFEVGGLHTHGKTESFAIEKRDQVATAIRFIPQHSVHPYVLQSFCQDEPLDTFIDEITAYQAQFGAGDRYRKAYLEMWGEHLHNLSKPGGYFHHAQTGSRWGGVRRRVRWCLYRNLSHFNQEMYASPAEEIAAVTAQVMTALTDCGVNTHLYDPAEVYQWLVPWFNPKPEGSASGIELARIHPLAYTPGEDYYGLDDDLFKAYPYFDVSNRCLVFNDQMYSTIVSVDKFTRNPGIGVWTSAQHEEGQRSGTPIQRLPEGCIICSTTVFTPNYQTENQITEVSDHSKGRDARSTETRKQIGQTKLALDRDNTLFPSSTYLYVQGDGLHDLRLQRAKVMTVLRSLGFDPIEANADLHALDTYIKYLPFSYKPEYDKYLYRNRLSWDRHIANVLTIYGASTGTGHHGIVFSNPEGMPFTFDPLNKDDKEQNSFMGILAPPGSGKSALLNQLIAATKATHNPYFVVIDVNGSFRLHHDYFAELGFDTRYIEISPESDVALPLFEQAVAAYRAERVLGFSGRHIEEEDYHQELFDRVHEKTKPERFSDSPEMRDPMGEMVLTAKLMITKGMEQAEKDFKPNDYNMLHNAILSAAEKVVEEGGSMVKPIDVVNALWKIADTGEMFGQSDREYRQERRHRAADMAETMLDYTKGIKGEFFNRDGAESWPHCDLLVLDLKMLAKEGYEDILYLTFIGLMNRINSQVAARRGKGRQTVVINDEAHIINMVRTLALFKRKSIKMWRKEGCWLWDSTQNIKDYPEEAIDILGVMEWLILLKMPKAEIEILKKFRGISPEEESMLGSLTSEKGKFVEGMVLSNKVRGVFRSVPPAWYLVLGQTEEAEYAARLRLMDEEGLTELEAAHRIAADVEQQRCAG